MDGEGDFFQVTCWRCGRQMHIYPMDCCIYENVYGIMKPAHEMCIETEVMPKHTFQVSHYSEDQERCLACGKNIRDECHARVRKESV